MVCKSTFKCMNTCLKRVDEHTHFNEKTSPVSVAMIQVATCVHVSWHYETFFTSLTASKTKHSKVFVLSVSAKCDHLLSPYCSALAAFDHLQPIKA